MVRVVMSEQMNLDEWNGKSMEENDQVGMKQKVDSRDRLMHIKMSDLIF